jgi:phage baseplate assembly protein gpV
VGSYIQGTTQANALRTVNAFYALNHPGGAQSVTFTAPLTNVSRSISAFRICSDGQIDFADAKAAIQVALGSGTDNVSTGTLNVSTNDGLIVGASMNVTNINALSVGSSQVDRGTIWSSAGKMESRSISSSGNYAATWSLSAIADDLYSAALCFVAGLWQPPRATLVRENA